MEAQSSVVNTFTWRRVYPEFGDDFDVTILFVPEIRKSVPPQASIAWIKDVLAAAPCSLQVLEFGYCWQENGLPIWQSLIHASSEFLDALQRQDEALSISHGRALLVGHGFGGTIIKWALNVVFERFYDPTYQWLRAATGVVLLGTPHPTRAHRERWLSLTLILRASIKAHGGSLAQAELEAAIIANLSEKFQENVAGTGIRVVTVFESVKTRISDGMFRSRKQLYLPADGHQLVDENLARIGLENEILVSSPHDHHGILRVAASYEVFSEFIRLLSAPARSEQMDDDGRSRATFRSRHGLTWASTLSDRNVSPAEATRASQPQPEELGNVEFTEHRAAVKLPCYLLKAHSRNQDFTGRLDVLKQLDEQLLARDGESQEHQLSEIHVFALCGLGGIGKTQIALEFAYSRKELFDAVFWVQADQEVKLDEAFSQMAIELQLVKPFEAKDRVVSRNAVLSWLSEPSKETKSPSEIMEAGGIPRWARWLLVFDNVENFSVLRDYIPLAGGGSILLTGRDPATKHCIMQNSGLDLEPLGAEEADMLLTKLTYSTVSEDDKDGARGIVRRLGGLPIAITHVAGIINSRDLSFAECLKAYEDAEIIGPDPAMPIKGYGDYQYGLTTVWALDHLSEAALALLQVLSMLDPDVIQESMLQQAESTADAQMPGYPSPELYVNTRSDLIRASLVRRNKQEKTLMVHRVVQDVVRTKMTPDRASHVFARAAELVRSAWTEDREWAFGFRTSEWQLADSMNLHILAMRSAYDHLQLDLTIEPLRVFVALLSRASMHLLERANYTTCIDLAKAALAISDGHKGEMGEAHADILMSLTMAYGSLGERSLTLEYAQRHFEERIAFERSIGRTPDSEFSFEGMAYTALALGLILNERYEEAIPLCVTGREVHERAPGFHNDVYWPHWAYAYHAWALIGLGRPDEALPLVLQTLAWRERHYGPRDTESLKTANMHQILGVIRELQHRPDDALEAFETALPLYCLTDGDSSYRTNQVRVKLGEHYSRLDRPEAAKIMFDTALKYFATSPCYKAETARTLFKKSEFLSRFGEQDEARQLRARARGLYRELHPGVKVTDGIGPEQFNAAVVVMSR